MKKLVLVILLIYGGMIDPTYSQTLQQSTTRIFVSFAFETITISTSAIGFTSATLAPTSNTALRAELAEYSLEGCQVRYKITNNGVTNPTSTVGTLLTTGAGKIYGYDNISTIKFIRDTSCSADATLSVHYYR